MTLIRYRKYHSTPDEAIREAAAGIATGALLATMPVWIEILFGR